MEAAAYLLHNRTTSSFENSANCSVIFEQDGVFIHLCISESDDDKMLGGTLSIVEDNRQHFMKWKALEPATSMQIAEKHAQELSGSTSAVVGNEEDDKSFTSPKPSPPKPVSPEGKDLLDPEWTLVAESSGKVEFKKKQAEQSCQESIYEFSINFEEIATIKKSKKNVGWKYLVIGLADGASLPPLHFHEGGCAEFLKALDMFLLMTPSSKNSRVVRVSLHDENALTRSFDELHMFSPSSNRKIFPTRKLQHPVSVAFTSFSKVTNFIQDFINPQEIQVRPANERATLIDDDLTTEAVGSSRIRIKRGEGSSGFEVITCANLGPRSDPPRDPPLSIDAWNSYKDQSGRIERVDVVKQAIFRGGVAPELRKEIWKYLLGYYKWNMSRKEIKQHKKEKEEDYFRMKLQWKSFSPEQEGRFAILRDHKSLIEKDVNRTDRDRLFYEGKDNCSLQLLHDILLTYVMYNFDLGYVQGMSDLLSPLLEMMNSEVDTFWCFVGCMNMVHLNFEQNQNGMKRQLRDLRTLIQFFDPQFFDNLTEKESNNLYFCFRWLLLRFKREFSFEDIQTLWEVLWTELPCPNFHLLFIVALLDTEKPTLTDRECGFNEILKHINGLSGKIDLTATLRKAEGMYHQIAACNRSDVSDLVCDVLGL